MKKTILSTLILLSLCPAAFPQTHQRPPTRRTTPCGNYTDVGDGHWISENHDGKVIELEDGSLWAIESIDQIDTALWLPIDDIIVRSNPNAMGSYCYILMNTDDEARQAVARYLGSH